VAFVAHDIDGIHHVGIVVEDLDEGIELYRRLGFQVTPPSHHFVATKEGEPPRRLGTANVIATFPSNYVEVLAQVDKSLPNPIVDPWRERFAGLHILVFNSPDVDEVAKRLDSEGINRGAVSTLEREVDTEEGPRMMRVRNVFLGSDEPGTPVIAWQASQVPEGGIQAVQNLTPEYLLQKRYMDHPNGAVDLVDYLLCVADPELAAFERRYQKYLGRPAVDDGALRVFELGRSRISLVPESKLEAVLPGERPPALPAFVAYTVTVRDLAATRELLERNGFTVKEADSLAIRVPAAEALGGAVVFRQAG
jgi:catechol 2,3-dioxygenase-like lactoylglutathione lyase family enzyme